MASPQTVSFTSPGYDYGADISAIERQRKLAQALQDQSMQQEGQQTAGGWVVPYSPFQGAAKIAQSLAAKSRGEKADEAQRELTRKAQTDLTNVLSQASEAYAGRPGRMYEDASGNVDNQPAIPADAKRAASIYMTHPMTAGMGTGMLQQEISRDRLINALRGPHGAPAGNPMASGGGSVMASPGGAGGVQLGGPAGGVPMEVWLQTDPSGKSYAEQLAKDHAEGQKPVVNRGYGLGRMVDGKYVPDQASLEQALAMERGKTGITAPLEPPVTIKLSGGQEAQLSRPEYAEFQKTGQLPARYGQAAPPAGELPQPQLRQLPPNVPESDRAAYEAVASGKVTSATPAQTPAAAPAGGLGVPGLSQPQEDQIRQARQQAGGKAVDEAFAKDYVAFTTGGASDAAKQLGQLRDVKVALETPGADLTGALRGTLPDTVQKFTTAGQKAIAMRERVEEVVQRSLRAVLGAQFTEKEGERLIARAYNPSLDERENAIRVGRLFTQLEQAFNAKQDAAKYFEKNGTLEGWTGKLPSIADFDPSPEKAPAASTAAAPSRFPRAKNPQTGAEVEWNGQAWVPVK